MASFDFLLTSSIIDGVVVKPADPIDFTDTTINQSVIKDVNIAAGASDVAISLDGLTGKHVILQFDGTVTVKLNGTGSTGYTLTSSPNNPAWIGLGGGAITQVHVSNAGASAVQCKLLIAAA